MARPLVEELFICGFPQEQEKITNSIIHTYTKNKRTINVKHKLRNNKENIEKLGTKIKDLGQGFRVQRHSIRNGKKQEWQASYKLIRYK